MKRFLVTAMVICGVLAFAMPASSYTIDAGGTNVGLVDPLIASTDLGNSGFATEEAWVESEVGPVTLQVFDASNYSWTLADGETDIWVSLLADSPDYFYLKTGAGQLLFDHFLFQNLAELNYAVIDFSAVGVDVRNIGAISHVGETGGTTTVPEPGTLLLLGSGLVGLALYGRKTFKR